MKREFRRKKLAAADRAPDSGAGAGSCV